MAAPAARATTVRIARVGAGSEETPENGGLDPLDASFARALERRNMAAHRADAVTEVVDLETFSHDATTLAISFDCLVSRGGQRLLEADQGWARGRSPVRQREIAIAYIVPETGRWKEKRDLAKRAVKVSDTAQDAVAAALEAARSDRRMVVVLGRDGRPTEWRTTDLE